ncbi:hypothetical protein FACS1894187_16050 [Synergistales bacterium]|nr:hypothetical protein FACS1894187_16050 [Synergistales bacterium]
MLKDNERKILVKERLEKSLEKISAAQDIVDSHPNESISHSYYATFHATHALFIEHAIPTQNKKSHRGVISVFYDNFVHTGIISKSSAIILGDLERMRNKGDYETKIHFSKKEALDSFECAKKFVSMIDQMIQEHQKITTDVQESMHGTSITTSEQPKTTDDPIKLAKAIIGPTATVSHAQWNTTYEGAVLRITKEHLIQKTGPNRGTIHKISKISNDDFIALTDLPRENRYVSISYDNTNAILQILGRNQEKDSIHTQ